MRRPALALLLMLSASSAMAAPKLPACPTIEQLDEKIISCGDDEIAAQKARDCADTIIASWQLAAEGLKATLEVSGSNQSVSEKEAKLDYERTLLTLESQIARMQDGTDLVADYVLVMVDYPDSNDDENSLSCFNENFHKVESIVKELDDEIVRAKEIYELAKLKHSSSSERAGKLDSSVFDAALLKGNSVAVEGQHPRLLSDITGTAMDALKRKRALPGEGEPTAGKMAKAGQSVAATDESSITGSLYPDGQLFRKGESLERGRVSEFRQPAASIGELIWKEQDTGTLSLERKNVAAGAAFEAGSAEQASGSQAKVRAPSSYQIRHAALKEALFSRPAHDLNLFQLVSRRYRASDLFRQQLP